MVNNLQSSVSYFWFFKSNIFPKYFPKFLTFLELIFFDPFIYKQTLLAIGNSSFSSTNFLINLSTDVWEIEIALRKRRNCPAVLYDVYSISFIFIVILKVSKQESITFHVLSLFLHTQKNKKNDRIWKNIFQKTESHSEEFMPSSHLQFIIT